MGQQVPAKQTPPAVTASRLGSRTAPAIGSTTVGTRKAALLCFSLCSKYVTIFLVYIFGMFGSKTCWKENIFLLKVTESLLCCITIR